jgi:hypothetical protein
MELDERISRVSGLLHEAAETHHIVYRITDGTDLDWATWYSDWLTRLSGLEAILGRDVVRSELTHLLVELDRSHQEQAPHERWEDFSARGLVKALPPT